MLSIPRGLPSSREKEDLQEAEQGFRSFIWHSELRTDTSNFPGSPLPLANLSQNFQHQAMTMPKTLTGIRMVHLQSLV